MRDVRRRASVSAKCCVDARRGERFNGEAMCVAWSRIGFEWKLDALIKATGLPEDAVSVVAGRPDDVLAARATEEGTLVVIGTVSRGPIEGSLIGSTAARVLREEGGDVLIVKPPALP